MKHDFKLLRHAEVPIYILLVSMLLSACDGLVDFGSQKIRLTDCSINGASALCGKLRVYENRAAGKGPKIELNIVVLPATGDQSATDPLFYFAGGPGGMATGNASWFKTELSSLNRTRDIVLVDQRGAGGSNPLICPAFEDISGLEGEKLALYYDACLKGLDADLRWYTTKTYADDVNDVRQALGYEKINIAGESYGATVVQVYLNEHPDTVRTAAILRGTLLEVPIFEHFADSSQRALDLVFSRCEQDVSCKEAFPDLKSEFEVIQTRLETEPAQSSQWDAVGKQNFVITPDVFANVIHYMLMGADTAAGIPRLVHLAAVEEDWDEIAGFYMSVIRPLKISVMQQAMPINILCTEPWALYRKDQVNQNGAGSYFLAAQVEQAGMFEQLCPAMPAPEPQAMYAASLVTNVPVLILNTEEDPQNPPANVADAAKHYTNSRTLFEPYRAHFRSDWACSGDVLTEYIELGDPKAVKAECLEKITPIPFDISP